MIDMEKSSSAAYAAAGVDITAGYKGVKLMRADVQRTYIPGVVSDIGGFGGLFAPNIDGMTEPISIETPPFADSQQSGAQSQPFTSIDIAAELPNYGRVEVQDAQIFANTQTLQPMRLIPMPSLPNSYTRTQIVTVTPQTL